MITFIFLLIPVMKSLKMEMTEKSVQILVIIHSLSHFLFYSFTKILSVVVLGQL